MVMEAWATNHVGTLLFRTIAKLKTIKLRLKQWVIEQGNPRNLTQGLINNMEIASKEFKEDPTKEAKRTLAISR